MITSFKAAFLERYPNSLTEQDKEDLREFYRSQRETDPNVIAYFHKIMEEPEPIEITYDILLQFFNEGFEQQTGKKFIENDDTLANIKTLCLYFSKNESFLDLPIYNEPDLNKGLLIIGDFGTGKSETMRVFQKMFSHLESLKFGYFSCNQVVHQFESCQDQQDRTYFWKLMVSGVRYFDDVKTEQLASNFGKKNIIKDIVERRYEKKLLTYISCNYKQGSKEISHALQEFRDLYGDRVYDRLFEMFNIIEWKGKSFRR